MSAPTEARQVARLSDMSPAAQAVIRALLGQTKKTTPAIEQPGVVMGGRCDSIDDPRAA